MTITVYGNPVAKARARTVRGKDGKIHSYTPAKTAKWEDVIRADAIQALSQKGGKMLEGALDLTAVFYLQMPLSIPKKRRQFALPTKRPDLDNLLKAVKDALRGIIYRDDAQIVNVNCYKRYANEITLPPCIVIDIVERN